MESAVLWESYQGHDLSLQAALLDIEHFIDKNPNAKSCKEINKIIQRVASVSLNNLSEEIKERISKMKQKVTAQLLTEKQENRLETLKLIAQMIHTMNSRKEKPPLHVELSMASSFTRIDSSSSVSSVPAPAPLPKPPTSSAPTLPPDSVTQSMSVCRSVTASQMRLLKSWNVVPTQKEKTQPKDGLRERQELLITGFGDAFFQKYMKPLLPYLFDQLVDLLRRPEVGHQIANDITAQMSPDPTRKDQKKVETTGAMNRLLRTTFPAHLTYLQTLFSGFIKDETTRSDFALVFLQLNPVSSGSESLEKTVEFFLKHYVPDLLLAVVNSLQTLLKNPSKQEEFWTYFSLPTPTASTNPSEQLLQVLSFIGQDRTESTRDAVIQTLLNKLQNDTLTKELATLLQEPLLDIFFPDPANISPTFKQVFLSTLQSVKGFLHSFNVALKKSRSSPKNTEDNVLQMMLQDAFAKGVLKTESQKTTKDYLESALCLSLEELLKIALFTSKSKTPVPFEKSVLKLLAGFIYKIVDVLITPTTLTRIILKIVAERPDGANPFDPAMPAADLFSAQDTQFSKALDLLVIELSKEVLDVYCDSSASAFVGKKLLGLIPNVGVDIQRALNRNFNIGAIMMPLFLLSQLCFKIDEKKAPSSESKKKPTQGDQKLLQDRVLAILEKREPSFNPEKLLVETESEKKAIQKKGDALVLTETEDLENLLKSLPFGTRNFALELIQRIYSYARHDLFLKLLVAHILDGVKKGL